MTDDNGAHEHHDQDRHGRRVERPTAAFDFSPASPTTGQRSRFTSTSTDPDGTIASQAWDLDGDGVFDDGTGATASQHVRDAGHYTVGLQVTDNQGAATR